MTMTTTTTTTTIISVPQDETFQRRLAEAMVDASHPGYQGKGWYVSTTTWKVFSPVNDHEITDECIDIGLLFDPDCEYGDQVDWLLQWGENDFLNEMLIDWARQESDDSEIFENDGSLADWVTNKESKKEAIRWGFNQPQWQDQLQDIEQVNYDNAIEFAEMNILSEVQM